MNSRSTKKRVVSFFIAWGGIPLTLLVFACSNPVVGSDSVPVSITIPGGGKGVPPAITSIALEITGTDMDTIKQDINKKDSQVTVEVPSGKARTFSLTVTNPYVTCAGSATADLTPGEEVEISIPLQLTETKIIIPDAENHRIVQIDDMSGSGWVEHDWSDYGFAADTDFYPWDIDFDGLGRIYIANNSSTGAGIIRLDSIDDTTPTVIGTDNEVVSLAVDRTHNLIYYFIDYSGDGSCDLRRCDLDGSNMISYYDNGNGKLALFYSNDIGVAVDDEGFVYVAWSPGWGDDNAVSKIDPSGGGSEVAYISITGATDLPWDVLYYKGTIYVASVISQNIVRLDTDLAGITGGPLAADPDNLDDIFYGPRRFVGINKDKIIVIDDSDMDNSDRLVSFSDIDGTGWVSYGSYGSGVDQFIFFVNPM
jgi:hypothetical protein